MRKVRVFVKDVYAGELQEIKKNTSYRFVYDKDYTGSPVSLEMPLSKPVYEYDRFPPYFEGVLPEGYMLEALLNRNKIDRNDYLGQLLLTGEDLVGDVTVKE